jgi:AcrR family transcriptional regulator
MSSPSTLRPSVANPRVVHPSAARPSAADRILKSARNLFYTQGIRAIGIEEIVRTARVTKPSLYRAFDSKDGLTTAYLAAYAREFWDRIETFGALVPDDPRARLLAYFDDLGQRAASPGYRGCALSNALVEYPETDHPVRREAIRLKQEIRDWVIGQAVLMAARDPQWLADGLLLLMEGSYGAGQAYPKPGPGVHVGAFARVLIDAH